MRLRIMPLEERIVLDGAAAAQVVDAAADAATDAAADAAHDTASDADSSDAHSADSGAADSGTAHSDTNDSADTDSNDTTYSTTSGNDTGNDSDTAADTDPVRVIAISSDVDQAQALADAALENVVTVIYDADSSDPDDIISQIESALGGREAESIAIAAHDLGAGAFHLSGDVNVSLGSVLNDADVQEFWGDLGEMLTDTGRIDLLSCGLAGTTEGEILLAQLEAISGHDVAASTDDTGNAVDGGDWILESGDVDAAATYFASSRLAQISGVLDGDSKVTASDGAANDYFGGAVSVSGDYAVVGASNDDARGEDSGSVYVFKKSGDSWVQAAKLTASDGQAYDYFGGAVSISGDYIVVGASHDDDVAEDNGSAYIFHRSGESWIQEAKLTSSKTAGWAFYGCSVSIDGDMLVVGANNDSTTYDAEDSVWDGYEGAAYVYHRSGTEWVLDAKLTDSGGNVGDQFGCSVDIQGTTIVVGAKFDDDSGANSGSAFVFQKLNPVTYQWTRTGKLTASDGAANDQFGSSVAVYGSSIMVGSPLDDDHGDNSGAVYVYRFKASNWTQDQKLTDSSGSAGDNFGWSVDMGADYSAVGAKGSDARGTDSGVVHIYENTGTLFDTHWSADGIFSPADGAAGDNMGCAVAVSGDVIMAGASMDRDMGQNSGSAYFTDIDDGSGNGGVPESEEPVVDNSIPSQYAKVGSAYSFQFSLYTFDDNNGVNNLTYTASAYFGGALPSWLHFDAATRTFYGTPTDSDVAAFPITVTATDADGNSVSTIFAFNVAYNFTPQVDTHVPNQAASEDAYFSYTVPSESFSDPDSGDTLTYTARLADGSALPSWLSWDAGSRTFFGTPANSDVGSLSIVLTASDQWGASVSDTFILTVNNTNDAPVASDSTVSTVEDTPYSFSANDFNFSDVDAGDGLGSIKIMGLTLPAGASLTLNGQAVTAGQVITAASLGNLVFTPPTDASGSALASFTFQVGDKSGAYSSTRTLRLNVAEANDAPTLTPSTPDMAPITEDASDNGGQTVSSILSGTVSDPETSVFGMAVTGLDAGNGVWQFSRNGGQTWIAVGSVSDTSALLLDSNDLIRFVPDGENADNPSITYRAWDMSSGNAGTKVNVSANGGTTAFSSEADTAHLAVTAVNDQPVDIALDNGSVDENSAGGTVVGNLSATDVDAGESFTYDLVDDDGGRFVINGTQLVVAEGADLNFEDGSSRVVRVRVTDSGGATLIKNFTISLNDVNEGPTGLDLSNQSVVEQADTGSVVGDFSAQDPDAGDNFTYELVDNAGGRFAINGSQLVVADGSMLDYENAQSHVVTVRVIDSGGRTYIRDFTIGVEDNTAPTDILLNGSVDENAADGTVVGDLSAVDNNHGDTFTYELLDNAGGRFALDGAQIVVVDGSLLDHEAAATRDIRVRVTDGAGNTFEKIISVSVNDVNEAPTDIVVPSGSVAEDSDTSSGIDLGVLSSSDPDAGDSKTYSVTGGANADMFEVVDGRLRIKAGAALDHETAASLEVEVTVTDSGGLTLSKTVTVTVTDVNEAPTAVTVETDTVLEDTDTSSAVDLGLLSAVDQDAGDSHTFAITGGADASLFRIENGRLVLRAGAVLDHETKASLEVQITAFDSGGRGYSQILNIAVGDVNEAPTDISISNGAVSEDADTSSPFDVGDLSVTDQDQGDTHTWTITGGANADMFQITDGKLQLKAGVVLDHETLDALEVEITVRDAGGLEHVETLTISVADVNEAPSLDNPVPDQTATEDAGFSYTLPADTFSDQDAGDSLTYSATLADGSALPSWLHFDAATRTFSGTPANGDVGVISVTVTALDQGGLSGSATFDLTVVNVNDAPVPGTPVPEQWATRDAAFAYQVPEGAFTDVDAGDVLTWSATLADGSALPAWLHFDAATRTFSGTPDGSSADILAVRLTVTDLSGASTTSDFNLNVQNAPEAAEQIPGQNASEDSPFTYEVPDTVFTDADADAGDTLTLSATLADGSALPSWLHFDAETRTFSGTPDQADAGSLRVALTATDSHGATVTTWFDLNVAAVNDAPEAVGSAEAHSVDAGTEFTFSVPDGLFHDPDGDSLRWTVTLADGSALPEWLVFDASTMTFSGTAMNTEQGTLSLMFTVFDAEGLSASSLFSLTVVPSELGQTEADFGEAPTSSLGNGIPGHAGTTFLGHRGPNYGSSFGNSMGLVPLGTGEALFLPVDTGYLSEDGYFSSEQEGYDGVADASARYGLSSSLDRETRNGPDAGVDFSPERLGPDFESRLKLAEAYDRTMSVFNESYVSFLDRLERMDVDSMTAEQLAKMLGGLEQMELVRARIESRLADDRNELPDGGFRPRQARLDAVRERIESLKSEVARALAEQQDAAGSEVVPANTPRPASTPFQYRASSDTRSLKAAG